MLNFYQHSTFCDDYHFVFILFWFMQKLRQRLSLTSILAILNITHALIGNVGDGNFRPPFYKKQYLGNGQAIVVVKFHTNIANKWLFMIHRMVIILYS